MAAASAQIERAYGVTNIKHYIPFLLDIDDDNYDAWREFFLTHCQSFDVLGHLDGTLLPADGDIGWTKRDSLVKLWLYGTLSKDLFKSTFKPGGTSREIWIRLENFFRNNKEARAIQLDHKLRTTEIGDLSIHAYCQELKSISDLLANVDAPVSERTLVTYMLNRLNVKYDNINVIMRRQPFPTFEEARSMLILEEERLGKGKKALSTNDVSSSSSKVLIATVSNSDPKSGHQQQQPARFNQNRGNRGRGNNRGRGRHNYNQNRPQFNQ